MLHMLCYITLYRVNRCDMAKGPSGRIVIELDPELKDELYIALEKEGLKMKQWFIENAEDFLVNRSQLKLPFSGSSGKNTTKRKTA